MRFDVVVVGAGPAGCVMAARLSEDGTRRVLLLEAGPITTTEAIDGVDFLAVAGDSARHWPDVIAPRPDQGARPYRCGRGIGGGSAVNAMLAMAGPPSDYDRWAALGATGWGWSDVRDLFDRALGGGLPQRVRTVAPTERSPLHRVVIGSAAAAGIRVDPDVRQGLTMARTGGTDGRSGPGWRRSSAADYLPSLGQRPKLVVRGDAAVDRLLMDGRRAVGVALVEGEVIEAGEVVLSAGAVRTPRLLLRSGVALPGIGRNLKDHPAVALTLAWRPEHRDAEEGHLAVTGVVPFSSGEVAADLQLLPLQHVGCDDAGRRYGAVLVALMEVRSYGAVTTSADAGGETIVVDANPLADDADRRRLRVGVRRTLELLRQPAVRAMVTDVFADESGTPAARLADLDDDGLDGWMRASLGGYSHAVGTCRMGRADDPDAVCDSHGRVLGYDGLRVVDASLFPDLPRVGPMLTCVVMAEHIARRWDRV